MSTEYEGGGGCLHGAVRALEAAGAAGELAERLLAERVTALQQHGGVVARGLPGEAAARVRQGVSTCDHRLRNVEVGPGRSAVAARAPVALPADPNRARRVVRRPAAEGAGGGLLARDRAHEDGMECALAAELDADRQRVPPWRRWVISRPSVSTQYEGRDETCPVSTGKAVGDFTRPIHPPRPSETMRSEEREDCAGRAAGTAGPQAGPATRAGGAGRVPAPRSCMSDASLRSVGSTTTPAWTCRGRGLPVTRPAPLGRGGGPTFQGYSGSCYWHGGSSGAARRSG